MKKKHDNQDKKEKNICTKMRKQGECQNEKSGNKSAEHVLKAQVKYRDFLFSLSGG